MFKRKLPPQPQEFEEVRQEIISKPIVKQPMPQEQEEEEQEVEEQEEEEQEQQQPKKQPTLTDLINAVTEDRNFLLQLNARIEALEAALFRLKALV